MGTRAPRSTPPAPGRAGATRFGRTGRSTAFLLLIPPPLKCLALASKGPGCASALDGVSDAGLRAGRSGEFNGRSQGFLSPPRRELSAARAGTLSRRVGGAVSGCAKDETF